MPSVEFLFQRSKKFSLLVLVLVLVFNSMRLQRHVCIYCYYMHVFISTFFIDNDNVDACCICFVYVRNVLDEGWFPKHTLWDDWNV